MLAVRKSFVFNDMDDYKRKRGPRFGHPVSVETRRKIAEAKLGKPCSSRTKIKPGQRLSLGTEFKLGQIPHNVCAPDYTWVDPANGYRMVRSEITGNGWRREHTVIAERALGRRLKRGEETHHINGNKQDNRNNNLLICTNAYHRMLERRMAYLYLQEHFS